MKVSTIIRTCTLTLNTVTKAYERVLESGTLSVKYSVGDAEPVEVTGITTIAIGVNKDAIDLVKTNFKQAVNIGDIKTLSCTLVPAQ